MADARVILFLQGPPSIFWSELARDFEAAGHRTHKINVCPGEWIFWRKPGAVNYRGRLSKWAAYIAEFMKREGVTDVVYFADQHIYHRLAARAARSMGVNAVAVEFGYLRPDWLTVERNGMGVYSHFPNDPDTIRAIAREAPAPDLAVRYPYSFTAEAVGEVTYNVANVLLRPLYPFFDSDRYLHPFAEYLSWLPRFARQRRAARITAETVAGCRSGQWPFFLLAMQLQSDYQIRRNSQYVRLSEMIEEAISSFAANAPAETRLIFKMHPLDPGLDNWPRVIAETAERHGVSARVATIDGGDLGELLTLARGCVMINSTVGLHAIRARCPSKVLGIAVFDIPGLTHQESLDAFWTAAEPVDSALADDFVKALARTIQVKGSFYDAKGRDAARAEIVRRVGAGAVNEPGAFVAPPPRLAHARRIGVPLDD